MKTSRPTDNSINVTCGPPYETNGPKTFYILVVRSGGSFVTKYNKTNCQFYVDNLYYSTDYEFLVRSCVPYSQSSRDILWCFILSTCMALMIVLAWTYGSLMTREINDLEHQRFDAKCFLSGLKSNSKWQTFLRIFATSK